MTALRMMCATPRNNGKRRSHQHMFDYITVSVYFLGVMLIANLPDNFFCNNN